MTKPINELSKKTLASYAQKAHYKHAELKKNNEYDFEDEKKTLAAASRVAWRAYHDGISKDGRSADAVQKDLEAGISKTRRARSRKMDNVGYGIHTALRKLGGTAKVNAQEENEMYENDTESQEIELTPNQAIIAAAIEGDHVAMADAFNAAVRAKIDAAMFGDDGEEDTE